MTEKLYWGDSYLKEFNAIVTSVEGNNIMLDRTAFYPTGGGQACDTGVLVADGQEIRIVEVKKLGEDIIHVSESAVSEALVGKEVKGVLNWERRYGHMRYHTAIHIIDGVIVKMHGHSGFSTGSQIYSDRARVDIDMPDLDRQLADDVIGESNRIIEEGHKVVAKVIDRDTALAMENLSRTEPGRELIRKLDVVRVIDIEGFDMQADGGTHVANTKEVGRIRLSKLESKGRHSKRMEILLEND